MEMTVLDRPPASADEAAGGVSPGARTWLARYDAATQDFSAVAGIVNAAHGRLVDLTILTLAEGHHVGPGLHTCAQYLAWQAGVSKATANQLVRIARRAEELPVLVDALRAGELSLDQADVVASGCPARYDRSATELAKVATVAQLRTVMAAYRERPGKDRPAADHGISIARDDDGATIRARVSNEEADLFERALHAMREDLVRQQQADASEGARSEEAPPRPTMTDALAALAETALAVGQAAHAGADRYLVTYHLHRGPDGQVSLTDDQGRLVADAHRRRLLCECTTEAAWHDATGTAISVGRRTRTIAPKLRRAILFRHRHRCGVPGCDTTVGLEIHHIRHWEDGGVTDTHNLVALCRHHHKVHHQGLLQIEGNADLPTGAPGGVTFAAPHRRQQPLVELNLPEPVHGPQNRRTLERLRQELDRRIRCRPGPVASTPTGERLQRRFVELQADPPDPPLRT
jgi:hypothetical protein